jgi:hypothetical protein
VSSALNEVLQRACGYNSALITSLALGVNHCNARTSYVAVHESAFDAVDGSSTGTEVPSMWALLRLPRFGGANHADGHDNRPTPFQINAPTFG